MTAEFKAVGTPPCLTIPKCPAEKEFKQDFIYFVCENAAGVQANRLEVIAKFGQERNAKAKKILKNLTAGEVLSFAVLERAVLKDTEYAQPKRALIHYNVK